MANIFDRSRELLKNLQSRATSLAQSGGLVNKIAPQQTANVNNFLSSNFGMTQGRFNPVAQVKAATQLPQQQALQYRQQVDQFVPRLNVAQNIQNPYLRFAGQVGEGFVNTFPNAIAGMAKLPAARNFQQGASDIASIAEAPLSLAGFGVGKQIAKEGIKQVFKQGVKQSIKQGAKTGAIYGGAFGGLEGLREGEFNSVLAQLGKAALGTGTGAVFGGVTGGVLSGGGAILKKYIFKSPGVEKQLRDAAGRWIAGERPVKPKGMAQPAWDFQLKFNAKHERNPYTPVYVSDLSRELPQPGLSIKYTNKPSGLEGGGVNPLLSRQQPQLPPQQVTQAGRQARTPEAGIQLSQPKTQSIVVPSSGIVAYSAEATPKTLAKIKIRNLKAEQQAAKADFAQWQKQVFQQEGTRTTTGAVGDIVRAIKTTTRSAAAKGIETLKDISSPATKWKDVFRNFKTVYGKRYNEVKEAILDPLFVKGKTDLLDDQEKWIGKISNEVESGFGIKAGSKESADVQKFGEGLINLDDLIRKYGSQKAKVITEADKWFRTNYDQLLNEVNAVRARIYPNNPDKIIPKRKDYYRHFNELSQGIDGLLNTLGRAVDVSPDIAGISFKTKPKSKFLSFAQRRLGGKTEYDAVGGFVDYVKAQTYAKHIDPHIDRFRQLGRELGEAGVEEGKGLNNFSLFLEQFADDLAGKTNPADRFVQETIGRKPMAVVNWLNQRIKANVILGNISSALAQPFNLPNGIAEAGPQFASKGIARSLASIFKQNKPMQQSVFLRERYFRGFDKFQRGMINNGRKLAAWTITALDEVSTKAIWNMQYEKAIAQGIKNPINYADDITRKMVAGRGIGEMALIQRSKLFQLVAPFQVEVTNAWHVIGDMIGEKAFGKLMTLAISSYVMNRAVNQVRGSDVSFDPINAVVEGVQAFQEEEDKKIGALKLAGRVGGEVLSNAPFGQTAASLYPEYGMTVGDTQYPTRRDLFGKGDPTRFGGGGLPGVLAGGLQDPLFKLIPPYGGQQLKRSIEGVQAYTRGTSETPTGKVRYPIEQNVRNAVQTSVLGQYAVPEARAYFDTLGKSKSEIIYKDFKKLKTPEEKAQLWDQYVKEGKITKNNVADVKRWFNDEQLGVKKNERKMRNLGVEDGTRAKNIAKEFNKLKTPEEKAALWDKYVKAKIITKDVAKQLKVLLQNQ